METASFSEKERALREVLSVALLRPVLVRWNSLYDALKQIPSLKDKLCAASDVLDIAELFRDDFEYIQ